MRKLFHEEAVLSPDHASFMRELERHAYVDDIPMTGNADEETLQKASTAKLVAARGCFDLSKNSSYPPYLSARLGGKPSTEPFPVLGLGFDPTDDKFFIRMKDMEEFDKVHQIKKRQAASILARPFDPLGLVAPAMLPLKKLRQKIDIEYPKMPWGKKMTKVATQEWQMAISHLKELPASARPCSCCGRLNVPSVWSVCRRCWQPFWTKFALIALL